jgi:8-oxo-dGTP pyrophosphatase MutT (NUDIX family)
MSQTAETSRPVLATSVLVVRDVAAGMEVMMARRKAEMRFLAGFWVFPGGSVDPADASIPTTSPADTRCPFERVLYAAAARELLEETTLQVLLRDGAVDADHLYPWARWITPSRAKRRYDTHFFLMSLPPGQEPRCDDSEIDAIQWIRPKEWASGQWVKQFPIAPPTQSILRELAEEMDARGSLHAVLQAARSRRIRPVLPKLHPTEPGVVIFPWDAEYPQLAGESLPWDADGVAERSSWPARLTAPRDLLQVGRSAASGSTSPAPDCGGRQ